MTCIDLITAVNLKVHPNEAIKQPVLLKRKKMHLSMRPMELTSPATSALCLVWFLSHPAPGKFHPTPWLPLSQFFSFSRGTFCHGELGLSSSNKDSREKAVGWG